jgi:phosphatidylglycerol:prolipoprotein diacylglycerol transferase
MNTISFPGLGIGEFELKKIAIEDLFGTGINVYWYGVIICIGLILAMTYGMLNAKRSSLTTDDFLDVAIVAIPVAVICARLFYVLTDGVAQKTFVEVIAIWDGGISIIGTIIGGIIGVLVVCLIKKLDVLNVFDLACRCLIIGQIIGRLGNFVNVEVYGKATELPWGMYIERLGTAVHPLFAYEMLWNIIGFVLLVLLAKNKKYNGEIFFTYIAWYGLGRTFLELLRDGEFVLTGYVSAIIAAVFFVAAATANVIFAVKNKKKLALDAEYTPMFTEIEEVPAEEAPAEEAPAEAKEESEDGDDN